MQAWSSPDRPELLADVQLGTCAASTVAWCPVNGLLAVGARQHAKLACVHLINPHCMEQKVTLAVPLQGDEDDLLCVTWSPAGCRRVLLTATKLGAVSAWSQLPPPRSSQQADMQAASVFTLGDWWCHSVGQLTPTQPAPAAADKPRQQQIAQDYLLSIQWLQPPPCWPYNARVLQEQDFQAGSVPNMFAPAAPRRRPSNSLSVLEQSSSNSDEPAAEMHWVEPGTLAFTAVLASGKAVVGWATWSVLGQLRWQLTPGLPLLPTAAAASADAATGCLLLAADAAWSPSGVVVALSTQQEPARVQVVELQGNPLHHQCLSTALRSKLPVLQGKALAACSIPGAAAACSVLSMSWDPDSEGQRLVVASSSGSTAGSGAASSRQGPAHVTLLSLTEQQRQQHPGGSAVVLHQLAPVNSVQVACVPAPQQYAWLLDGLLVGQQLLDAQTLAPLNVSVLLPAPGPASAQQQQHGTGPQLQAIVPSPHRVALAMVRCSSSSGSGGSSRASSSLLLYSIPPVSKVKAGGTVAPTLAGRLVWSLLLQRHSWDLVQHLQHAAHQHPATNALGPAAAAAAADIAAGIQSQRVAHVLGLVDRKLGVQPDEVYSMYAMRWDALKYAVVCRTPGAEARAFSMDLRLRLLVPVLEHHLTAAAREEEVRQSGPTASTASGTASTGLTAAAAHQHQHQQLIGSATAPLGDYAMSVLEFEIACLNTWIHRRIAAAAAGSAADGGAAAEASVKAVPCIRFCMDFRFNAKLAATGCKAAELAKGGRTSKTYGLWKLLHKPSDGRNEQPANWEDWLLEVVPGPFELHPQGQPRQYPSCIVNLRLPADQLLRHMQQSPEWQQVPVLTDADITARATRLGLLPAHTLLSQAKYAQQAHLHSCFRQQLPRPQLLDAATPVPVPMPDAVQPAGGAAKRGAAAASLAAAKRRRWERQIRDALGSTSGAAAVGSDEVVDLVNMCFAAPSELALHSVDGAVLAREVGPDGPAGQGDARSAVRRPAASIANTWAYGCPITGEMWVMGPCS